uniref:Uncharacterized protein n=1 Tax=Anguilla anguilla TaxID=7936 RepID=A0A0E9WRE0_ANGAN
MTLCIATCVTVLSHCHDTLNNLYFKNHNNKKTFPNVNTASTDTSEWVC